MGLCLFFYFNFFEKGLNVAITHGKRWGCGYLCLLMGKGPDVPIYVGKGTVMSFFGYSWEKVGLWQLFA